MSTNEVKSEVETITVKKSYEGFNDNLELVSKEVEVKFDVFTADATAEKVMAKLNEINRWSDAANFLIRNEALKNARKEAGVSGTINRGVLMEFIKPYRELPQFASIITVADKRKASAEEWNKQTNAICEQIKGVAFIMEGIKKASELANATEE